MSAVPSKPGVLRESDLLAHIERRSRDLAGHPVIRVGPGDDAAVLSLGPGTLATVDHLVEGRHFERGTPVDLIARKAVARSVSDIAAMGGVPRCGLATGCLPPGYAAGDELFDRMAHWARHWGAPLAGGDIATSPGPLVLTVTVLGEAHGVRGAVLRSGARPGDEVWVTGAVGSSLETGHHLTFEPRVREGWWLCDVLGDRLHAMIDVSDGVGRDAGRVAAASGVRIEIDAGLLPLRVAGTEARRAVADGEDYELLLCVEAGAGLAQRCAETGVALTRIGRVREGAGCVLISENGTVDLMNAGWDHGG
ncbi:MAG: thiamine-phosphate kinase [Planctomycetota bacterium]|nr:thiamine-phosphate kinase [Planctomycetota bacterium]